MSQAPVRTRTVMGLVLAVLLAVLLASCSSEPAASSPEASPSASPSPTPLSTIGLPADDGARIVEVESIDDRTRDLTIDSPAVGSLATGTDPRDLVKVRILLPGAFEAQPDALWPSLYLLHGGPGTYTDWTDLTDVEELTTSTELLVVMPAAGDGGWYSDWWNDGQGGIPMWETFHTVELPQLMERNWHASDKRAVAGLSMGGYGAMAYAARNPGLFVAAASYSGVLSTVAVADDLQFIDRAVWGDPQAQADVWQAHDPVFLADALSGTTLYVSYGDGTPGPFDSGPVPDEDPEAWIAARNETFLARLTELGIPVTVDAYGPGSHDWPYWERALHNSLPLLLEALAG